MVDELVGSDVERVLADWVPDWIATQWPFCRPRHPGRDLSWAEWLALPRP